MARTRRIKVKGVRMRESVEMLQVVLALQSKRLIRERRERDAQERAKRRQVEGTREQ